MSASDLTRTKLLWDKSAAVISPCGTWRYWLHRRWSYDKGNWTVFVMLNPSTADATQDDPTIRRCISFAKSFGTEGLIVVNLFAARATLPGTLLEMDDPEGPENHAYVTLACELAAAEKGKIVCAWGAHHIAQQMRGTVLGWIDLVSLEPVCLGYTKSGAPRHPLYVPANTKLQPFRSR